MYLVNTIKQKTCWTTDFFLLYHETTIFNELNTCYWHERINTFQKKWNFVRCLFTLCVQIVSVYIVFVYGSMLRVQVKTDLKSHKMTHKSRCKNKNKNWGNHPKETEFVQTNCIGVFFLFHNINWGLIYYWLNRHKKVKYPNLFDLTNFTVSVMRLRTK